MIRMATLTSEFSLFCWLIFIVQDVMGELSVQKHFVQTAILQSPPYRLDDLYLKDLSLSKREKLCEKTSDYIQPKNQMSDDIQSPNSAQTEFNYVPKAHVYKFDDKEEWLSIRCPNLPPFYISHEFINKINHHWHIRIVKPEMEAYEFQLETFIEVSDDFVDPPTGAHLPSDTHYFYKMDTIKRSYLCSEARRMIDYPIKTRKHEVPERPTVQTFKYSNDDWEEDYLAFKCGGEPVIFLRTGDLKNETNVIWIALVEDDDNEDDIENDTDGSDIDKGDSDEDDNMHYNIFV